MSSAPHAGPEAGALRAEHDDLARRLAIRQSVDEARRALYRLFFGLLSVGLTVKLAWDRYGVLKPGVVRKALKGPPLFLWLATAIAVVLLVLAIRSFRRTRRLQREEDALYARYRALRETLRLDP
jgi:heme exporter protein D